MELNPSESNGRSTIQKNCSFMKLDSLLSYSLECANEFYPERYNSAYLHNTFNIHFNIFLIYNTTSYKGLFRSGFFTKNVF
jgi:hypothetical protein